METDRDVAKIKKLLENYIKVGGFPEVVVEKEDPIIYLNELYNATITKDIVLRHNIKYRKTIRDIADYILANVSNYVTYTSIKKHFNLGSEHTAKNYLNYLEDSYLFVFFDAFSFKAKEIKNLRKKLM